MSAAANHSKSRSAAGGSVSVLFVCLGNICRSPAAEGTFAHTVTEQSLAHRFHIDSCGTSAYHIGERANSTSRATARRHGIELNSRARQFASEDFERFDYIFAMDGSNYAELCSQAGDAADLERIWKFRLFDPEFQGGKLPAPTYPLPGDLRERNAKAPDVPDPYYGGPEGFEEVQQIMLRTSIALLAWIGERHQLTANTKRSS